MASNTYSSLNRARKTWHCIAAALRLRASVSDFPNARSDTPAEARTSTRCHPTGVSLPTSWLGLWITPDHWNREVSPNEVLSTMEGNSLTKKQFLPGQGQGRTRNIINKKNLWHIFNEINLILVSIEQATWLKSPGPEKGFKSKQVFQ